MKLAIFSPGFIPVPAVKGGAIEQLTTYIINENENEHKFDIDLYTVDDNLLNNINYSYTNIIRFPAHSNIKRVLGLKRKINEKFGGPFSSGYPEFEMYRLFKKDYYDKVLIENNMDLYRLLLKKKSKEDFYFHLHNNFGFDSNDVTKSLKKTKLVINTAKKILVVSNYLKNKLERLGAKNVARVYNAALDKNFRALSLKEKNNIRNKYNLLPEDIVFTFVGRICDDKGIDKLLEAFNGLKNYNNVKCLIVGNNFFGSKQDDAYIRRLKMLSINIQDKITFTGYIPNNELYKIYGISDCVVIPSQWEEVFGVVALEAMKMHLPTIASLSGALPEILTSSTSLFVSRDNNFSENLKKAIIKLAKDKFLRDRMGEAAFIRSRKFPGTEREYYLEIMKNID